VIDPSDPTGHDAVARALAYLHPAWMIASLGLALLALRAGLGLRRARLVARRPPNPAELRRHLRVAKPAVWLLAAGFALGPLSMWWLRGRAPFATAHALAGVLAIALFAAAAWIGRRLEHGRSSAAGLHALLATLGVLFGALAAAAGFVLLP
jgi:hypothetical protein